MHVALIDPSLFTLPYDLALAEGLQRAGHRVAFYGKRLDAGEAAPQTVRLRQHFYPEMVSWGVQRWPEPVAKVAKGLFHVRAMRRLIDVLRAEKPDVIHVQWLPLPVVDRHFLGALGRIAPLVITAHDSQPFNANPGSAVQKIGALDVLRAFDRVIVHTEQGRARLVAAGVPAGRIDRIAHGFLTEDAPVAPPAFDTDPAAPVDVLLFGKIKPYKGVDLMIEAVRRLPEAERARVRVLVVGKPYMDMAPLLNAAAGLEAQIRFDLRFVPDEEMPRLFEAADVIAFPYREIEMSGVLMAALRTARPILASRIGGFAELLEDGREALLVPPGDVDALCAGLGRLIRETETRRAMSAALTRLAESVPSWDEIARLTGETYGRAQADRQAPQAAAAAAA